MDRQTDRWKDRQTDGQTDRRTDRRTYGQADRQTDKLTDRSGYTSICGKPIRYIERVGTGVTFIGGSVWELSFKRGAIFEDIFLELYILLENKGGRRPLGDEK